MSDGESEIFAFFTPDAEISFPKAHEGRSIKDIALGSVFGLTLFEILATPYGRSEQQLQLCIDEIMAQMTGVRLGIIGRPFPLRSREGIQSLLEDFLQLEYQASISEEERSTSHRSKKRNACNDQISTGLDMASKAVFETDVGEATSFVDTEAQSQLATQLAPRKKRKRDADNEQHHGVNLSPPVDVRAKSKNKRNPPAPELLSLLDCTEKRITHSVTSESESTLATKLSQTATITSEHTISSSDLSQTIIGDQENGSMNPTTSQLEPDTVKSRYGSSSSASLGLPPTAKLASNEEVGQRLFVASERFNLQDGKMQAEHSVVNDAQANCDNQKVEPIKEGTFQQPQPCSSPKKEQVWYHIFETTPAMFNIPKRQQDILNRSDSWNPAPPGKTFPAGNLPREILEELQQSYLERQAKSSTETSERPPQIDIPKTHSTPTSEISSPLQDNESPLSGWYSSPVAEKMSTAPQPDGSTLLLDSSPQAQIPKLVARKMYTALPPDSSARLPNSSPQIQIQKPVAENVGENIENITDDDINSMDELESSYGRHKEGREIRMEQGETSLQFHKASHDASTDTDVEMSLVSDSDMETSVPRALRQVSQDPLSITQSRSSTRTSQTQEKMSAGSFLQTTETPYGILNPSTPTSAGFDSHSTVYNEFRAAYPDYTGTMEHFTQLCRKLRQSRQHQAVWDDYVIRHLTDYEQYVMTKLRQGSVPIDYDDYYNDKVRTLKFTKGVLNAELLDNLLPTQEAELPSRSSVEHQRPRRLLDSYRPGRASGWF